MSRKHLVRYALASTIVICCLLGLVWKQREALVGYFYDVFPVNLPALEPIPSYILWLYPQPGQEVYFSEAPSKLDFQNSRLQHAWSDMLSYVTLDPGNIYVILSTKDLVSQGDFWEAEDIEQLASLMVNGTRANPAFAEDDGYTYYICAEDCQTHLAKTGVSYFVSWEGPKREGFVMVTFQFKNYSYSWWYKNVR